MGNSYYNQDNVETIQKIEGYGHGNGFCSGNIIKYLDRAGKKTGESRSKDLYKAFNYAYRLHKGEWAPKDYEQKHRFEGSGSVDFYVDAAFRTIHLYLMLAEMDVLIDKIYSAYLAAKKEENLAKKTLWEGFYGLFK